MARMRRALLVLAILSVPASASASVVINEFLYDAQGTDADQEYVELYNNGSSDVDLTKWKINDGSNHTFNVPPKNGGTGSITIAPGGYVLLVDNATNFIAGHPSIAGTIIDTVLSLSNTSATISLIDESGATVDSVSYTKDQGANGDGNSLQKSGSSWIVAAPTPNAANGSAASQNSQNTTTSQTTSTTSESTNTTAQSSSQANTVAVSSYVAPPEPTIFADGGDARSVIVSADTEFYGRAYDKKKQPVDHVRFSWNFGDGSIAEGQSVTHHFDYPGRYMVVLSIAEDRNAASDYFVVTAEPAQLGFENISDGGVAIRNLSGRDLDLSKWLIRSFNTSFTLPDHSIVLRGETLRIPQKTLGFWSSAMVELAYPNGVLALKAGQSAATAAPVQAPTPEPPKQALAPVAPKVTRASVVVSRAEAETAQEESPAIATTTQAAAAASAASTLGSYWWLYAVLLGLVAGGTALFVRRVQKTEWDIVEDSS